MKKLSSVTIFGIIVLWACQSYAALDVFVTIPPQKWLSEKLGGDLVNTEVLIAKGEDPHTFEPRPRQMAALSKSKIYFTLDLELESLLVKKLKKNAPGVHIYDSAEGVTGESQEHNDHDLHDEHDSHDSHEADEDGHHHSEDPHIWLSPSNLITVAENMSKALVEHDSANSEAYAVNLKALKAELKQLDADIRKRLTPFEGSSFYVFHPSFGHFAKSYGLQQIAVEIEGKSPQPKQLSALIAQAKKDKVKVIFVQPQFDTRSAIAVANAIGGEVVPLDALAEDVEANLLIMSQKIESALKEPK
jgi:zinc transport system substrate-binding protein